MKKICACLFALLLCALLTGTIVRFPVAELQSCVSNYGGGIRGILLTVQDKNTLTQMLTDSVPFHERWIDVFGGTQRVMGVDCIPDTNHKYKVYRLNDGTLTFVGTENPVLSAEVIASIQQLKQACEAEKPETLFVSIPQKVCPDSYNFSARGVKDLYGDTDTARRKIFSDCGFTVLDLHKAMHAEKNAHETLYFRTDHHWKPTTGLWAAGKIAEALQLDTSFYTSAQYTMEEHPNLLIGTLSKRTGRWYSDYQDDLTIPIPRFATDYTLDSSDDIHRSGDFHDTFLNDDALYDSRFKEFVFNVFLSGGYPMATITNASLNEGKHVLLIYDSFSDCVIPYLAASCKTMTIVDPRTYDGSIADLIADTKPDAVCVTLTAHIANEDLIFN